MSSISEEVRKAVEIERDKALSDIQVQLDALSAKEREISDDFIGWKKGLRPSAMMTLDANVLSFDPLAGVSQSAPVAIRAGITLIDLLVFGGLAYLIFKKRRK